MQNASSELGGRVNLSPPLPLTQIRVKVQNTLFTDLT